MKRGVNKYKITLGMWGEGTKGGVNVECRLQQVVSYPIS